MFRLFLVLLLFSLPVQAQDVLDDSDDILRSAKELLNDANDEQAELISELATPNPEKLPETHAKPIKSNLTLSYAEDSIALNKAQTQRIREEILPALTASSSQVVEIRSYAPTSSVGQSDARRLSLNRALEIVSVLEAANIDERQMYVRALGPLGETQDHHVELELKAR